MTLAETVYLTCLVCGEKFPTKLSQANRRKTCGKECNRARRKTMYLGENNPNYGNRGPKNPLFKTGEKVTSYGYKMIYRPDHPNSQHNGYIFEHRYIMSESLGRPLEKYEDVHHLDGDKQNNNIDNLAVVSRSEHTRLHNKDKEIVRDSETGKFLSINTLKEGE